MAMTLELEQVARFLLGEGELDGVWFGDKPSGEQGSFWWRKYLREAMANLTQPAQAVDVGAIREVADRLMDGNPYGMSRGVCRSLADRIARALAGEQAGWRELAEMERGLYVGAGAHGLADIPASPTPDKETQR